MTVLIGSLLIALGIGLFVGAGIGHYYAVSERDKRQRKLNNRLNSLQ